MHKSQPSLIQALLQAREAALGFFRPLLNQYELTEQQWRVIRILSQPRRDELESHQLAEQACILRPSLTGVLVRLERDGLVRRWKPASDRRRLCVSLTAKGVALFEEMSSEMTRLYKDIQRQFGAENFRTLMRLLQDLGKIDPAMPGGRSA
ncbi:homoprotocatechuate degradation operon regulator HpaR [Pseudomonas sp. MAP12]|uniref:Homoprotocatechuate degradation operon regulator HpaR n=1 Tax=Geopseudomonas aromaticivorans TaxID=2849492 RepID=A0ABS6MYV8_9GAMM|nr:homoprotocatechuate degradation operon regulator HpaR [Pseudomonas aromaticivorans]MBV2133442.1 homoprotocatechuate degradation operon regulator HpaR [Pseudomonas aromaticivorans]